MPVALVDLLAAHQLKEAAIRSFLHLVTSETSEFAGNMCLKVFQPFHASRFFRWFFSQRLISSWVWWVQSMRVAAVQRRACSQAARRSTARQAILLALFNRERFGEGSFSQCLRLIPAQSCVHVMACDGMGRQQGIARCFN